MKDLRIDTQRLVQRVRYAHVVQKLAHQAARREYNIEALIQPTQIAAQGALRQLTAEAPAENLRQIGVIERRYRNAAPSREAPARPRPAERRHRPR